MKKVLSSLTLLLVIFLSVSVISSKDVHADSYYKISELEVLYNVQKNGDALVTQTVTYYFDGAFNGITNLVSFNKADGVEILSVEEVKPRAINYTKKNLASKGDNQVYTVSDKSNSKLITVYSPTSSGTKTFRFTYTIKNMIEVYNDVAQFNWLVVGKDTKVNTDSIKVKVNLPQPIESLEDFKVFAHGNLLGTIDRVDSQTAIAKVNSISAGESIEIRLLFPPSIVPDSTKRYNSDKLSEFMAQEKEFADEANRKRDEAKKLVERKQEGRKFTPIAGIITLINAVLTFFAVRKLNREKKANFTGDYYRDLPGTYGPAITGYLVNRTNVKSSDLLATLMQLEVKNLISMTPTKNTVKKGLFLSKETDDILIAKSPDFKEEVYQALPNHQKKVYDWFVSNLAKMMGGQVSLKEISFRSKDISFARKFNNQYNEFVNIVSNEGKKEKFFETNSNKVRGMIIPVIITIALGLIMFFYYRNLFAAAILIAPLIAMLIIIAEYKSQLKFTQYGADQNAMWMAFKKFLLTFSNMDKAELPSLEIWDHYLVYATSLGVAKEVIKQLPQVYSPEEINSIPSMRYYPTYYGNNYNTNLVDDAVSSAKNRVVRYDNAKLASSTRSSSSGSGGGFSSGSSGGGGGGGFGAF